jgi:hypothetical protein
MAREDRLDTVALFHRRNILIQSVAFDGREMCTTNGRKHLTCEIRSDVFEGVDEAGMTTAQENNQPAAGVQDQRQIIKQRIDNRPISISHLQTRIPRLGPGTSGHLPGSENARGNLKRVRSQTKMASGC